MTQSIDFEPTSTGNLVLQEKGGNFYISYHASPPGSDDGPETALCHKSHHRTIYNPWDYWDWFILNGDFREEYKEAFPKGFKECLEIFKKYRGVCESPWSSYPDNYFGLEDVMLRHKKTLDDLKEND